MTDAARRKIRNWVSTWRDRKPLLISSSEDVPAEAIMRQITDDFIAVNALNASLVPSLAKYMGLGCENVVRMMMMTTAEAAAAPKGLIIHDANVVWANYAGTMGRLFASCAGRARVHESREVPSSFSPPLDALRVPF